MSQGRSVYRASDQPGMGGQFLGVRTLCPRASPRTSRDPTSAKAWDERAVFALSLAATKPPYPGSLRTWVAQDRDFSPRRSMAITDTQGVTEIVYPAILASRVGTRSRSLPQLPDPVRIAVYRADTR